MKIIATLALVLLLSGCTATNQTYYEQAQLYLGAGEYRTAAMLFSQLGEYRQSADYTLYAQALDALTQEDYALARANFHQVKGFKSAGRYLALLDAIALEKGGHYEAALNAFDALGSFSDAPQRAAALREEMPQLKFQQARQLMRTGEYAQAADILETLTTLESAALLEKCRDALHQQALTEAQKLQQSGDFAAALAAFDSLGDTLQSAQCREAWRQSLTERVLSATMADADALMAELSALSDHPDAQRAIDWLQGKFAGDGSGASPFR